jgi:hypothetical protein
MMIWLLNISQFYNMLDINASSIQCEKKGNKITYWNSNTQGYAMAFTTEVHAQGQAPQRASRHDVRRAVAVMLRAHLKTNILTPVRSRPLATWRRGGARRFGKSPRHAMGGFKGEHLKSQYFPDAL